MPKSEASGLLTCPAEIRAAGDGEPRKIVGTAAVFGQLSVDLGGFREMILPGAFTKTLKDGGVKKSYWNHNYDEVLGSTKASTLTLEEKDDGLHFEIDPPSWADRYMETIRRGDVDQMSFGFRTIRDRWEKDEAGHVIRYLVEVKLYEVSPVSMPAYPQTDAQVRSIQPQRLQELIVQAEHDLLDEEGREELRNVLAGLQKHAEPHHSEEPEPPKAEDHSTEPDGSPAGADGWRAIDERIGDLAHIIR